MALQDNWWDVGGDQFTQSMQSLPSAQAMQLWGQPTSPSFMGGFSDTLKGANQWMKDVGMIGGKDAQGNTWDGWGGMALGAAKGLGSLYMGMQQYGLMKDQLQFSKDAFNKNYALNKNMVNSQLEDRQNRRVAEGLMPNTTSTADYMAKYGVK